MTDVDSTQLKPETFPNDNITTNWQTRGALISMANKKKCLSTNRRTEKPDPPNTPPQKDYIKDIWQVEKGMVLIGKEQRNPPKKGQILCDAVLVGCATFGFEWKFQFVNVELWFGYAGRTLSSLLNRNFVSHLRSSEEQTIPFKLAEKPSFNKIKRWRGFFLVCKLRLFWCNNVKLKGETFEMNIKSHASVNRKSFGFMWRTYWTHLLRIHLAYSGYTLLNTDMHTRTYWWILFVWWTSSRLLSVDSETHLTRKDFPIHKIVENLNENFF